MYKCFNCKTRLIWGGDFTFEDFAREGEGIVSNFQCLKCGTHYEVYSPHNGNSNRDELETD